MIVLETERLTLRRLTADDAPFILRLLNEPSFLRFIGDKGVRSIEDAREYIINGPIDSHERDPLISRPKNNAATSSSTPPT